MTKELLRIVLAPIARFCIRRSVKLQELNEVFKELLVDAARGELEKEGQDVTSSRLSVMTGVHRKDIRRLMQDAPKEKGTKDIVSRVIGQWQQSSKFLTKGGKPRTLTVEGNDAEFMELVRSVSVDLNPYTVLFELERSGAVTRTSRGLKLESSFYFPKGDLKDGFALLADDVDDLIRSVEGNLNDPENVPHLHLKTEYDRIPKKHLPKIRDWILEQGSGFQRKVNKFLSQFDADVNPKYKNEDAYIRFALGSFAFSEEIISGSSENLEEQQAKKN